MTDPDAELAAAIYEFAALLADTEGRRLDQDRYEQVETTRLSLGQALAADPARTARLADRVLPLLAMESGRTSQLVFPLVAAVGRQAALTDLISLASEGSWRHWANACTAAYWVDAWAAPVPLDDLREQVRAGRISAEQAQERIARALKQVQAILELLTDLWPHLWLAAAKRFTGSDDPDLRCLVQAGFPLEHPHHLPEAAPFLAEARRIAENDPCAQVDAGRRHRTAMLRGWIADS
ncbi:hypothetical protein [Kitasatospora sp. NPDC048407]|uniref:hypothetical protein n=1 Tax=Kitasatospora sp. NPDC048407 TaxID=3364051 RepID=UPI0037153770